MSRISSLTALLLALALLSACETTPTPPNSAATSAVPGGQETAAPAQTPGASAYPAADAQAQGAYPAAGQVGPTALPYPPPTPEDIGFLFTFDEPLRGGDTRVSGTGPAGVPVRLVSITRNGETLSEAVIGDDGTFMIEVPNGLTAGDQIGLQIGDLTGTQYTREQFLSGPGYRDVPLLGIMVARANIQ